MNDVLNRAVSDLYDLLRGSGVSLNAFELSATLLVWGHLSDMQKLPKKIQYRKDEDFVEAFQAFCLEYKLDAKIEILIPVNSDGPSQPLAKLETRMRKMSDAGVFRKLEFADIAATNPEKKLEPYSWPIELAELSVSLINPAKTETVYCPWEGAGQIAARLSVIPVKSMYLEIQQHSIISSLVCLTFDSQPEIHFADPIQNPSAIKDGELVQFDHSIAAPPFGKKYQKDVIGDDFFARFKGKSTSSDVLAIQHMLSQTRKSVAIVLPSKILFSSGAEATLRKDLLQRGQIKTVVALPSKLYQSTGIQTCLLILDSRGGHDRVLFVDATGKEFSDQSNRALTKLINLQELKVVSMGEKRSELSEYVSVNDIIDNDASLLVSRYVLSEKQRKVQAILENGDTIHLGDACSLYSGFTSKAKKDADAVDVKTLDMTCFPDRGYIQHHDKSIRVDPDTVGHRDLLQPLDILIVTKGNVGKVGIVPPDIADNLEDGWLAPSFATVVRCDMEPGFDPRELFLQLRSPLGQHLLEQRTVGSSIPIIRVSDLKIMKLKFVNADESKELIRKFEQEIIIEDEIEVLRRVQKDNESEITVFSID